MGNLCAIFKQKPLQPTNNTKKLRSSNAASSNRWSRTRSSRKEKFDDASIREQAIAAAILFKQHQQQLQQQNGGAFDRSSSLRYPNGSSKKNALPRSSSSRARSLTDPLLQPHQLVNQVNLLSWLSLSLQKLGRKMCFCFCFCGFWLIWVVIFILADFVKFGNLV